MQKLHEIGPNLKRFAVASALTIAAMGAVACGQEEDDVVTDRDKKTDCLKNDLNGRNLEHTLDVPGEAFKIKASYSTDYDVNSWRITDTKAIDIKLEVVPEGDKTPSLMLENLHADASIKAKKAAINGLPTDNFDDRLHVGTQPGFQISPEHPYRERFLISGFSETLTSGWGFVVGSYGSLEIEEKRLTEKNLIKQGAYGQQIAIVADILIKESFDNPEFYKTVVADDFIVPLKGHKC